MPKKHIFAVSTLLLLGLHIFFGFAHRANAAVPNSADQVLFRADAADCANLTDHDLDLWKSRGVDGFVCSIRHLRSFGGKHRLTGDPNNSLSASDYALQKKIRDTNIVGRAKARGLSMYLD